MSHKKFSHETNESISPDAEIETSAQPAEEACEVAHEAVPAKNDVVARAVYRTCYTVSYGVVFGSLLIAKLLIPKNSAIDNGLRDGAVAAREAIDKEIVVEESEAFVEVHEEDAPVSA